jgi:hypothetical protein
LRLYGVEPHNKWGALVWGTDTWAQQDVLWTDYKNIADTLSVASTNRFNVSHLISEEFTLDSIVSKQYPHYIYETFSFGSRVAAIYRINNGWYSRSGDTINLLEFPSDNFTEVNEPSTTWSEVTAASTDWTEL